MKPVALGVLLLLASPAAGQQQAVAKAEAGLDHSHVAWSALLAESVHPGGKVDYRGLAGKRVALDAYLETLQAVKPGEFRSWSAAQQAAFWINAYNAYTVSLILDHYPVESIKDVSTVFTSVFSKGFIPLQHLSLEHDDLLSLGEVEHDILAHGVHSPLFHFAIVCASASCPKLRAEAYTAVRLPQQLAEQARGFLADPAKNDQEARDGRLDISKIFDWSDSEFESHPGGVRGILRDFAPPAVAEHPALDELRLGSRDYDWSLNEWKDPTKT